MFNPLNGKCDQVNQHKCRPGEQVYIPSNLKDIDLSLRNEDIKEKRSDNKPKANTIWKCKDVAIIGCFSSRLYVMLQVGDSIERERENSYPSSLIKDSVLI